MQGFGQRIETLWYLHNKATKEEFKEVCRRLQFTLYNKAMLGRVALQRQFLKVDEIHQA
jgi:hypothetical protein